MKSLVALTLLAMISGAASAKTFQTSYLSMTIPDPWSCAQSGNAWVCLSNEAAHSKEAVIVLSAKVAAPEDNLANFASQFKRSKTLTSSGAPIESKVISVQTRNLAATQWVQGQQLGSEIPDFYTLYIATVKDRISIQVSFSAEKSKYPIYSPVFERVLNSIKLLNMPKVQNLNQTPTAIPTPAAVIQPKSKPIWIWVGILVLGLVVIAILSIFKTGRKKISRRNSEQNRTK